MTTPTDVALTPAGFIDRDLGLILFGIFVLVSFATGLGAAFAKHTLP